jgi:hypothetical protein
MEGRKKNAAGTAATASGGGDGTNAGASTSSTSLYHAAAQKAKPLSSAEADTLHAVYCYILSWPVEAADG